MSSPAAQPNSRVSSAILRERDSAREQLAAAWQLQVYRVEEALASGWQEHIQRVFEERFAGLSARLEREFAAGLGAAARTSSENLYRAVHRLAACQSQSEWAAAVLDSTAGFRSQAALFSVGPRSLAPLQARGLAPNARFEALEVPLADAPTVAAAIAARETVTTLVAPAGLSNGIAGLFESGRCAVLPLIARERSAAVLIAAGDPLDVNGLEAMAAIAGAALERRGRPAPPADAEDSAAHLRAQRWARVRAAEIRLYKSREVLEGRAARRLYAQLKEEIESARAAYKREFLQPPASLPDYLHAELIRTLANEDVAALGKEYPGPLA